MSTLSSRRTGFSQRTFLDALSLVLHDLRNPLGVIVNVTYLMSQRVRDTARPVDRDALLGQLAILSAAAQAVLRLIGSVSQVIDTSAGQHAAEPEWVDNLNEVLRNIVDTFQTRANDARVLIFLRPSEPLPAVHWDIHQIQYHVLNNLVTNAIEAASPDGIVEITAHGFDSDIEIRVADNGPGVPPENRRRIFQRHVRLVDDRRQAESPWKRGLGLYSAELFTQLHSGRLSVEDGANGEGVVFVLRLPVNPFAEENDGLPRRQPTSRDSAPSTAP